MTTMMDQLKRARERSVPLIVVRTSDQQALTTSLRDTYEKLPVLQWDAARGITAVNDAGEKAKLEAGIESDGTVPFVEAMVASLALPAKSLLIAHNAHRQVRGESDTSVAVAIQAIANLRNAFKVNFRTLVLAGPIFTVPPELEHDVVVMDEELPGEDALRKTVLGIYEAAEQEAPDDETIELATRALAGLSEFAAEQATAMSMTKEGLDLSSLWERKRLTVENTEGMSVYRGTETFADLVSLDSAKEKLLRRTKARTPVGVVLVIDEIDKVLANVEHDTSGVRMDQLRTLLAEMEDNEWRGMMLVGPPGSGKSAIAKAFGNEAGVPTVFLDFGGMEGSLVGESEAKLRHAMKIVKAIGSGNAFVIATSNNASIMRPELQRRFTEGTFYVDVMTDTERDACVQYYMQKYDIPKQPMPKMKGWTGAEVRNACREAWDTGISLIEAAKYIVPISQSRADEIEKLRQYAQGRFLDATKAGPYKYDPRPMADARRAIEIPTSVMKGLADMKES